MTAFLAWARDLSRVLMLDVLAESVALLVIGWLAYVAFVGTLRELSAADTDEMTATERVIHAGSLVRWD